MVLYGLESQVCTVVHFTKRTIQQPPVFFVANGETVLTTVVKAPQKLIHRIVFSAVPVNVVPGAGDLVFPCVPTMLNKVSGR